MTGITIEVFSSSGEILDLKLEGFNSYTLMSKLPFRMRRFVKKCKGAIEHNGENVVKQKVTFHGKWNISLLKYFTEGLDRLGIEWWLDP